MGWYAYLAISPDPGEFRGVLPRHQDYPVEGDQVKKPKVPPGAVPQAYHIKFGDQAVASLAYEDLKQNNPNCTSRNIHYQPSRG